MGVEEHPRDIPHRLDYLDRTAEIGDHDLGPEFRDRSRRRSLSGTITGPLPLPRNSSTTESLTLPEAQAAPVIRYMAVNLAADR